MIHCRFETGGETSLRHATADVVCLDDENNVLWVRRAPHLLEGGKWAIPGGYMNRDETWVENARREFLEETGYTCTNLQLFDLDSRPVRPANERQNVSAIFLARIGDRSGDFDHETTEMQWFPIDASPSGDDVAFGHDQNVALVRRYLEEQFTLPLLDGQALPAT